MNPFFDIACRMAATQHGHITRRQLLAAGIDRDRIKRWRADGRLTGVHHGVYAIGRPAPSAHGRWMAAVLACGEGAVLSHLAAAQLLRILPGERARPEVTVPTTNGREQPRISVHRVAALHKLDAETHFGIPVTSPARTLLDLSPRLSPQKLTRACHEAWIRHATTPEHVNGCIARNPRKPGARRLRAALGADVTLSTLENRFVALLRDYGLPPARTNIDVHGDKVDCHWPEIGLTVELMSYRFHASRQAFEADIARRRRSNHLAFSYGDVVERQRRRRGSSPARSSVVKGADGAPFPTCNVMARTRPAPPKGRPENDEGRPRGALGHGNGVAQAGGGSAGVVFEL